MRYKKIKYILSALLFFPLFVFAQGDLGLGYVNSYEPPARDLPQSIITIVNYVLIIVGVLALAMVVYGGFLYITAHGDTGQIENAKNTIIFAVIGIVVIGLAAALVNFVIRGVGGYA